MERVLLITGFDPFDGAAVNSSWEVVRQLPEQIGDLKLCKLKIPTVFGLAAETVLECAQTVKPAAILCLGVASSRSAVTPERIGINVRTARIPDNQGNQPREIPIVPGGADGLFSTVNVTAMANAIEAAGFPGAVSNTAGTFVCNDTLYTLLHHYRNTPVKVGFIHVPQLPEQGQPSLPLADTVRAVTAAIETLMP